MLLPSTVDTLSTMNGKFRFYKKCKTFADILINLPSIILSVLFGGFRQPPLKRAHNVENR